MNRNAYRESAIPGGGEGLGKTRARGTSKKVTWEFDADFIDTCNCDWGCPCTFNAPPTMGNCVGFSAWHIRKGHFDGTRLEGVRFAAAAWWPGPINQGNGVAAVYIDRKATPEQRKAIEAITSGQNGGGFFGILPLVIAKWHPAKVVPIEMKVDGPNSWVRIQGIAEARHGEITEPASGATTTGEIVLPTGIEWKRARVTNAKSWWIRDGDILAVHTNKSGFVSKVKYSDEGCLG